MDYWEWQKVYVEKVSLETKSYSELKGIHAGYSDTTARELMINQEARRELDKKYPNPTWEEKIAEKMARKGLTRSQAIADIYETAAKSNAQVNKKFGMV